MILVYKFLYIISKIIEGNTGFYRVGKKIAERGQKEEMSFMKLKCEKKGHRK